MSKMIQIRNVPDSVHRRVKARAAEAGMSLSDFLLREVERLSEQPSLREILARLAALPPVRPKLSDAALVRAERDSR